jgi:hypothetical protein
MLTRETQRDLVPLVATDKSAYYNVYIKAIANNAPGEWGADQEEPTWKATQSDVYAADDNGKQVKRRDLSATNPINGKHFTTIFEFTEMPLLQYAAAAKGISVNSKELGIWVPVNERN